MDLEGHAYIRCLRKGGHIATPPWIITDLDWFWWEEQLWLHFHTDLLSNILIFHQATPLVKVPKFCKFRGVLQPRGFYLRVMNGRESWEYPPHLYLEHYMPLWLDPGQTNIYGSIQDNGYWLPEPWTAVPFHITL